MYSYGSPHTAAQKQDDQHERTFSSYVRIQVVVLKTYLGRWTIGRSGERGSGISVLPARYDDDDDDINKDKVLIKIQERSEIILFCFTLYQTILGYFMPTGKVIAFLVHLYLNYFLYFFLNLFFCTQLSNFYNFHWIKTIYTQLIFLFLYNANNYMVSSNLRSNDVHWTLI